MFYFKIKSGFPFNFSNKSKTTIIFACLYIFSSISSLPIHDNNNHHFDRFLSFLETFTSCTIQEIRKVKTTDFVTVDIAWSEKLIY